MIIKYINNINNIMDEYKCNLCDKKFKTKTGYFYHANKTIKCNKNTNKTNETKETKILNSNICMYCNKQFKNKSNATKHMKNNCKINKNAIKDIEQKNDKISDKINKLENTINDLKNMINIDPINSTQINITNITNNTTNNTTNNITNNIIQISNYNDNIINSLPENVVYKCLKSGYHAATALLNATHFDPEKIEYHNVYITSLKGKYGGRIYENNSWKTVCRNNLIDDMYNNIVNFIQIFYPKYEKKYTNKYIYSVKDFIELDPEHDKMKEILQDFMLALLNGGEITKKTIKEQKQQKIQEQKQQKQKQCDQEQIQKMIKKQKIKKIIESM